MIQRTLDGILKKMVGSQREHLTQSYPGECWHSRELDIPPIAAAINAGLKAQALSTNTKAVTAPPGPMMTWLIIIQVREQVGG
jgi:hypothetical protein